MNVTLYTPHPSQLKVHGDSARFKVVNFGRRTGKSTLAQNYIIYPGPHDMPADWPIKGAMQEVGRYWIIAPTYTQAKSIYWRGLMFSKDKSDSTAIPKELIAARNETELILTLVNGSTIELKGADNPDSLRGAGIKGVVLDEYAFWKDPTAWEYVIQPSLSTSGGWAMFISTPNGLNHFNDLADYAKSHKNWSYHKATIWDNPNIPEEEKKRLQSELDEDTFAQEYLAEFRKMRGLVYPEFDKNIHVYDPQTTKMPLGGVWALGLDPGTTNALAGAFFFIDYADNWWLTDELYERGIETAQAARLIKQKMGSNYYSFRVADSAAAQFILDMNGTYGLAVTGVQKTRDFKQESIRLNRQLLRIQELTGRPKLFVARHCRNFIREIQSYHYPDKLLDRNESEEPVKENDHLMDAWQYLRVTVNRGVEKEKPQRKRIYSDVTGRVIGYEDDRQRVSGFDADEAWDVI